MKTRILTLFAMMMIGLSSLCFAHATAGSINGMVDTSDGPKIIIYTPEGYSVATVMEYLYDYPLEDHDVIEVAGSGYLTRTGRLRIEDMHTGSNENIIYIEGVHLTESEALRWLLNGGEFE